MLARSWESAGRRGALAIRAAYDSQDPFATSPGVQFGAVDAARWRIQCYVGSPDQDLEGRSTFSSGPWFFDDSISARRTAAGT